MEAEVSFGAWVSQRRQALDLTRAELARCAGCSVSALRKIEGDERRPSRQLAELLADCLQIPSDQHPTFLQVARGQLGVERLMTAAPTASNVEPAVPLATAALRLLKPPTPLIGRKTELAALARLLRDPHCRLLTMVGPGGIGKTRLAIETAFTQQELFSGEVYFVSLVSLTSPLFVVPAIADALGFTFSGPVDLQMQLLNYLRQKCLLLILDNFEHLLEGGQIIADVLRHAPGVKLLITSRERLNLQGEWLFDLQGLPVPPPDQIGGMEEYSAVELFVQSARRVQAEFVLKPEQLQDASRICQLVEGMPLAIELAAAWVSVLTCQEIVQEIERSLDFLATSMRDAPKRQQSLRATFDHSWNLLTASERSVLCRLAIFQGGFEREAAEQVAGATLPLLLALVSKSLVRRSEAGRYNLHEVIRQYASVYLAEDPHGQAAHNRHCDFYLTLLRDREKLLKSAAQGQAMRELTDEIDNLRSAWTWAVENEKFSLLGASVRSLGWFFEVGGLLREGIEQLELLVQHLRAKSNSHEWQWVMGQTLTQQSLLFFRKGQFDRAQELLAESLSILRPLNKRDLMIDSLIYLGVIAHLEGDIDRARSLLEEGLLCAQSCGDEWFAAYAIFNLGYIDSLMGQYIEGHKQMLAGLAIWRRLGDPHSIALGLNFLAPTLIKLGYYEEGQANLQESLNLCKQSGNRWGMGTAYRYLGLVKMAQRDLCQAQSFFHKSLETFGDYVVGWDIARSFIYLGEAVLMAGDLAEARKIYLEALRLAEQVKSIPLMLEALTGLAQYDARSGKPERAFELSNFVMYHPASVQETRDRARQIIPEVESQFDTVQIQAFKERTANQSLEAVVEALLR